MTDLEAVPNMPDTDFLIQTETTVTINCPCCHSFKTISRDVLLTQTEYMHCIKLDGTLVDTSISPQDLQVLTDTNNVVGCKKRFSIIDNMIIILA